MEMEVIDGVKVEMAIGVETVLSHIKANLQRGLPGLEDLAEMRKFVPIALVGGGPSLNKSYEGLRKYRHVMVAGSAHDHLVELGISPNWCVVSDPDAVMALYLTRPVKKCRYLIASYCHEAVFDALKGHDVVLWHPNGGGIDFAELGAGHSPQIGGGCTIATRAVSMALSFGFEHIHLYGFDTCVESADVHHAYPYKTEEEILGTLRYMQLERDGPKFLVPGYLVAQLFDFKHLIETYDGTLELRVAGGGLIDELLKVAAKNRKAKQVAKEGEK